MAKESGLGKGLASLIPQRSKKIDKPQPGANFFNAATWTRATPAKTVRNLGKKNAVVSIPLEKIASNPHQPRKEFNKEKLQELASSIKSHGIIQPIVVTEKNGSYELVAGERRFQAAQLAQLEEIPAIIREVKDQEQLELAVVENVQRHDLNPIEEAQAYHKLANEFGMSQETIAQKVGKARSVVANKIRLLNLPAEMQRALIEEKITEGHAKALLMVDDAQKQKVLFEMILKNNLTVRQLENKTRQISVRSHKRTLTAQKDPRLKNIEDQLSTKLATRVKIKKSGNGGQVVIEYYSDEELNNLVNGLLG